MGAAALGALVAAWATGLLDLAREPARLQAALRDLGPLGMAAYVGVFGLTQPLGMPGIALVLAASLVWSAPVAIALALAGFLLSSSLSFGFARSMGRDWVAARRASAIFTRRATTSSTTTPPAIHHGEIGCFAIQSSAAGPNSTSPTTPGR